MSPTSSHVLVERLRAMLALYDVGDHTLIDVIGESLTLRWANTSVVAAPGDPVDSLFLVMSGAVEVEEGDETITELGPGESFGATEVLTGSPYERRHVAAPDCELMVIPRTVLDELLEADPGLRDRLLDGGH